MYSVLLSDVCSRFSKNYVLELPVGYFKVPELRILAGLK